MKTRIFSVVLALVMVLTWLPLAVSAAAQPTTIAAFSYDNKDAVAEVNLKENGYGSKNAGYDATSGSGKLFASVSGEGLRKLEWTQDVYGTKGMQPAMTGGNNNPWGKGAYLETQVSTVGFSSITFSAQLGATNKGPKDYKLQYSLDGKTFKDVGATYSLKDNRVMEDAFVDVALPADAANQQKVCIRIVVSSETLVNGTEGLAGTTSGETAVNNIVVKGVPSAAAVQNGGAAAQNGGNLWLWVGIGGGAAALVLVVVLVVVLGKKKSK